jgi:translation initiation factor 2 beta subunit (eIF-2beta)/eIF-5
MSNEQTYWGKFTGDDIFETFLGYRAELPIVCSCGLPNEWIRLDENTSFWGCKKCFRKKMKSMIKLVKPYNKATSADAKPNG